MKRELRWPPIGAGLIAIASMSANGNIKGTYLQALRYFVLGYTPLVIALFGMIYWINRRIPEPETDRDLGEAQYRAWAKAHRLENFAVIALVLTVGVAGFLVQGDAP